MVIALQAGKDPYDTSMNRHDLVRGPEPWAPPLTNIYPKDWPSQNEEEVNSIKRKKHYPWSPPRRPSSAHEALLGSPKNIFSPGRRASLMSKMNPEDFYKKKTLRKSNTVSAFWNDENDINQQQQNSHRNGQRRRLIRSATANGRFQTQTNKYKNSLKKRPQTGPSSTIKRSVSGIRRPISGKSVQFDADSPARGRKRPQTAKLGVKKNRNNFQNSGTNRSRPRTALTPVQNRADYKSRPKSAMPSVRPQTAMRKKNYQPLQTVALDENRNTESGRKEFKSSSYKEQGISRSRPHTVGPSPSRRSGVTNTVKRSKSASAFRGRPSAEPHHRRPTTATKTKRKYRVGLWPSGKWKYDYGEHITHHGKSRKV